MKLTRANVFRVTIAVAIVFTVTMLVQVNPARFQSQEHNWEKPKPIRPHISKPTTHYPFEITPPLPPEIDPFMTPFGHVKRLYSDCPDEDTTKCLEFLARTDPMHIRNTSDEFIVFHTAWSGGMVPVHQFLLYSYLATQNLSKSIFVYWLEAAHYHNFTTNPLLKPFMNHPNFVFKCFNLTALAKNTPLELAPIKDDARRLAVIGLLTAKGALWGDLVRMLILYKYGGIYVDVDIILLRPMDPFMTNEFAYSWAAQGKMNTAVFSFRVGGKTAKTLFRRIIGRKSSFHPMKLYEIVTEQRLPVVIYPAAYFDPAWNIYENDSMVKQLPFNRFDLFFLGQVHGEFKFWDGAYTYHIHNQYKRTSWDKDSWAGRLLQKFKNQIRDNGQSSLVIGNLPPDLGDLLEAKCKT